MFDEATLRRFATWLLRRHRSQGGVTGVRLLHHGAQGLAPWEGLYRPDDLDGLCEQLHPIPRGAEGLPEFAQPRSGEAGCYFTLNPVVAKPPPRLDAGQGELRAIRKGHGVSDPDMQAYSLVLIDVDPRRPKGISATDAEKAAAGAVMDAIVAWLAERGVRGIRGDSGNGLHLLIPIVPQVGAEAITAAREKTRSLLHFLHATFSTDAADVDRKNHNPSRISKLFGTAAVKGEATPERPHRVARVDLADIPPDVDLFAAVGAEVEAWEAEQAAAESVSPVEHWIGARALSELAGIRPRVARMALADAAGEHIKAWRGATLNARFEKGRWEVEVGSLPPELAAAWRRAHLTETSPTRRPPTPANQSKLDQASRRVVDAWREAALRALPLDPIYADYLTGRTKSPGWLECRDPWSPSGKDSRSAQVADGTGKAARGTFHSFRTETTLNVFDFLIQVGRCVDFDDARRRVAELSGIPLPQLRREEPPPLGEHRRPPAKQPPAATPPPGGSSPRVPQDPQPKRRRHRVVEWTMNTDPVNLLFANILDQVLPLERLFRHGDGLVFVRPGLGLMDVTPQTLPGLLASCAELATYKLKKGERFFEGYDVLPGPQAKAFILSYAVQERVPFLRAYSRSPFFDRAWRWIGEPGWHAEAGIFYDGPRVVPARSVQMVQRVVNTFAWKDEADMANFVAALLTCLTMEHWLRGHPMLVINGNKPGVGKSTLARILGMITEGKSPASITYTSDDTEFEKQIGTRILAGDRLIVIDNVKTRRAVSSAVLERSVTDDILNYRLLGRSLPITRINDALFVLTMNSTQLVEDLRRRALPINLEVPGDVRGRDYPINDLVGFVEDHRLELLAELAGMVKAWLDHGRPPVDKPARHSVSRVWSETMDAILRPAGLTGFMSNFEASAHAFDDRFALMAEVAAVLHDRHGHASEWVKWIEEAGLGELLLDGRKKERTPRGKQVALGQLFADYLDATFEDDEGRQWTPTRDYPRGPRNKPVYGWAERVEAPDEAA